MLAQHNLNPFDNEADRILNARADQDNRLTLRRTLGSGWYRNLRQEVSRLTELANKSEKLRRVIGSPLEFSPLQPEGQDISPGFQVSKPDFPSVDLEVRFYATFFAVEWITSERGIGGTSQSSKTDNLQLRIAGDGYLQSDMGVTFDTVHDAAMYLLKPLYETS